MKFREEILNYTLADILRSYTFIAEPEIIMGRNLPDVLIIIGGLKVIIEGRTSKSYRSLKTDVKERLETGLADISMGICYKEGLNVANGSEDLKQNMLASHYDGFIYHWSTEGISFISYRQKSVTELVEILNSVISLYIRNNLLSKKVEEIDNTISRLTGYGVQTSLSFHSSAIEKKLQEALGITEQEDKTEGEKGGDSDGEEG